MEIIRQLINFLVANESNIYIQAHNFPDHDAVSSAFAMQKLLGHFGIKAELIYEGQIQRLSLKAMIERLDIPIKHSSEYDLTERDKIIIVDGCKGNKNVTDLIGDEVAVIDHHIAQSPDDVIFSDIRPEYGATASIITSYYRFLDVEMPHDVATALIIGIEFDTAQLSRGVSEDDIRAFSFLFPRADMDFVNTVVRNYIQINDLEYFKYAIDHLRMSGRFAFCYFENGCGQNLLGILADYYLALEEAQFVLMCANNDGKINFSLRSERDDWNAASIIEEVLEGIGFGGGHSIMAGGFMPDAGKFTADGIFEHVVAILERDEQALEVV